MFLADSVKIMTTFSIASILGDQNPKAKQEEEEDDDDDDDEDHQQQFLLNNSVQHLYNLFCKNAAMAARFNEQHHTKTNPIRSFPIGTTPSSSSSSTDFYSLHKLNNSSYQGKKSKSF